MIYTKNTMQFLGEDTPPEKTSATKSDVAGAVGKGFDAVGDIFSSFFKYKSDEIKGSMVPRTSGPASSGGMDKNMKTTLLVGGGVAAAALLLVVALK